MFNKKYS